MNPEAKSGARTSEREIFLQAIDKSPPERAAFLESACGGDRGLQRRVEELVSEQAEVGRFLEDPGISPDRECFAEAERDAAADAPWTPGELEERLAALKPEEAGDRIGPYKLLQQIGEGGFGIVWMAEQERPVRRRVALKIIKVGMDTRDVIARFEQERQAVAMMEHPNIAKVFDAGATPHGRPFFVMELVRGIPITAYCDQAKLPTNDRLDLFVQVCQAVQHAHQKGIIHRDIKPSNVLVTTHDGVPVPKVIDFGVAKATQQRLTELTLFTRFEHMIGTPLYMSPEQAEMSGLDVDTRSDIYSLGVLLYELLTGRTPLDGAELRKQGFDEIRRVIREEEPPRPSLALRTMAEDALTDVAQHRQSEPPKLIHSLRGDLDWIVMKALEKDRTRRYATANDLAFDIQRNLDDEPVLARPPNNFYRLQKLFRRHRGAFAAAAAIAATLVAGAVISIRQAVRARDAEQQAVALQQRESSLRQQAEAERERAEREKASARLNEYIADVNLAQQSMTEGNYGRAFQLLTKHHPDAGDPHGSSFEWRYLWRQVQGDEHLAFPAQADAVGAVAFSPDGTLIATGLNEKVTIWDVRTKSLRATLPKGGQALAFLPDGGTLITASRSIVRLWNTKDWSEERSVAGASGPFVLSKDGRRLAAFSREGVRVFDTANWNELGVYRGTSPHFALSADGEKLAFDAEEGVTIVSIASAGNEIVLQDSQEMFPRFWFQNNDLTFSPDGKSVVAARNMVSPRGVFVLSVWDAESGQEIAVLPGDPEHGEHTGLISGVVFSPDGRSFATASCDHSIRVWDFTSRRRLRTIQGHRNEVWAVAFSPDGQSLVSGARDGGVNLWPVRAPESSDVLPGDWIPLAFSDDSKKLAALGRGTVAFFNLATQEAEEQLQLESSRPRFMPPGPPGPPGVRVALNSDLTTLVHSSQDGVVDLWDTRSAEKTTLKIGQGRSDFLTLAPDGNVIVTGGREQPLQWWDVRNGTGGIVAADTQRAVFSADGRMLAAWQRGNVVQMWDVSARAVRNTFIVEPPPGPNSALSADGTILATTGGREDFDNAIRLWETATGKLLGTCTGHKQGVWSVAFSPDGQTLASGSDDSTLKFWNIATQQELLTIRRIGGTAVALAFSRDGYWLAAGHRLFPAGEIRLYRAPLPQP